MTRRRIELTLRLTAMVALLGAFVSTLTRAFARDIRADVHSTTGAPAILRDTAVFADTSGVLVARSVAGSLRADALGSRAVHAHLSTLPSNSVRGVLQALRAADVTVTWTDSTSTRGLAIAAVGLPDPDGRTVIRATRSRSPLVLRDAAGVLDSQATAGTSVQARRVASFVTAYSHGSRATVSAPTLRQPKRLLILARAGWEAKLAMAALEERGWLLDGRLELAPRTFVTVGRPARIDTGRYAAVFVLDSGVATSVALEPFVRTGGGTVLVGDAALDPSLTALNPARVGELRRGVAGALLTTSPRDGLGFRPLSPRGAAVVLLDDGAGRRRSAAVVGRRLGAGRIVAVGYRDSWRWRMEGNDDGIVAHRAWWNMLAVAASYAEPMALRTLLSASDTVSMARTAFPGDAAPFADLVARIGVPTPLALAAHSATRMAVPMWWLFLVALTALLLEWASRRLRGAP